MNTFCKLRISPKYTSIHILKQCILIFKIISIRATFKSLLKAFLMQKYMPLQLPTLVKKRVGFISTINIDCKQQDINILLRLPIKPNNLFIDSRLSITS